jgi:hypothetical protein
MSGVAAVGGTVDDVTGSLSLLDFGARGSGVRCTTSGVAGGVAASDIAGVSAVSDVPAVSDISEARCTSAAGVREGALSGVAPGFGVSPAKKSPVFRSGVKICDRESARTRLTWGGSLRSDNGSGLV